MTDDELIDAALASYSAREPLAGLEQRTMTRIGGTRAKRGWRWWALGAAVVGVTAMLTISVRVPIAPMAPVMARAVPPPVPAAPPMVSYPRPLRHKRKLTAVKSRPFPASPPLTREELALVAFFNSSPEAAMQTPLEPVVIERIEIEPLQSGGLQE